LLGFSGGLIAVDLVEQVAAGERVEKMKSGIELIAEERERQVSVEGWTPEHDDEHDTNELTDAAICYALFASEGLRSHQELTRRWPWEPEWWKPAPNAVRNLVKAGALIAAEIDRLQRTTLPPAATNDCADDAVEAARNTNE
jgi:hypothetical protein